MINYLKLIFLILKQLELVTKALSYWPYKFLTDDDADQTLDIFEQITNKGIHLAIMAHFNHVTELKTGSVKAAIKRVRETGSRN